MESTRRQNKAFVANYRKLYNSIPTVDSVAGYVGAQVVWNAFKKLGGKVPDQDALSKAVLETKIGTPRGPISFDPETNNVIQKSISGRRPRTATKYTTRLSQPTNLSAIPASDLWAICAAVFL